MNFDTKTLVRLGLLLALEIVLSRFLSFQTQQIKIGFSFIAIVLVAMNYGPVASGIVAGLADFLGTILFPKGTYFPGITLTAVLTGAVWGMFLYKKQGTLRILGAVLINQFILSLFLQSYWLFILYANETNTYSLMVLGRVPQCILMTFVQFFVIYVISTHLKPVLRKIFD